MACCIMIAGVFALFLTIKGKVLSRPGASRDQPLAWRLKEFNDE